MRAAIALAAIPVAVWAIWPAPQQPVVPKAVAVEGVRAQRMDENTFVLRWRPAVELPPTVVRAITMEGGQALAGGLTRIDAARRLPKRTMRRASLRGDVCARHGMRRVEYTRGRWKGWRCRR